MPSITKIEFSFAFSRHARKFDRREAFESALPKNTRSGEVLFSKDERSALAEMMFAFGLASRHAERMSSELLVRRIFCE
jgi:hypothetical protein